MIAYRLMLIRRGAVVPTPEGEELTIWDSKESEFSLGLEYQQTLRWDPRPTIIIFRSDRSVARPTPSETWTGQLRRITSPSSRWALRTRSNFCANSARPTLTRRPAGGFAGGSTLEGENDT